MKWMGLGGFYDGMDEDARSKHLANIISKRCPGCNTQIEKNEGCLQLVTFDGILLSILISFFHSED